MNAVNAMREPLDIIGSLLLNARITPRQFNAAVYFRAMRAYPLRRPRWYDLWEREQASLTGTACVRVDRLTLLIDVVQTGRGLRAIEGQYRMRHGMALDHVTDSLDALADARDANRLGDPTTPETAPSRREAAERKFAQALAAVRAAERERILKTLSVTDALIRETGNG